MKSYADISVFDKNGQLVLIVEVKAKRGTSSDWAAQMRRNIYAHGLLPPTPFFLLALPDRFYLWKNSGKAPDLLYPTQIIDPNPFLKPYFENVGIPSELISGKSFELIVTACLNQVLMARTPQDLLDTQQAWIIDCGLFDYLAGGHLGLEVAA